MPTDPPTPTYAQQAAALKSKLKSCREEMNEIYSFSLISTDALEDKNILEGMVLRVDPIFNLFNSYLSELSDLYALRGHTEEFPSTQEQQDIKLFRNHYYYVMGMATSRNQNIMTNWSTAAVSELAAALREATAANTTLSGSKVRLPKTNLPTFDGTFGKWPLYRDTFKSLIHDNEAFAPIEKFHFLTGSLKDHPLNLIKNIPISDANYDQAWDLLMKHYNNPRKLASSYLNQLLTFKLPTNKPQSEILKSFLLSVTESITALENLNIPNKFEFILFELAIKCLDQKTRQAFEIAHSSVEFPTYSKLKDFVETRYLALDLAVEPKLSDQSSTSNSKHPKFSPDKFNKSKSAKAVLLTGTVNESSNSKNKQTSNQSTHSCFICGQNHILRDCGKFKAASPSERLKMLKDKQWRGCKNCLYPHHRTSECPSKHSCFHCKFRHHSMLHLPQSKPSDKGHVPSEPQQNNQSTSSQSSNLPSSVNCTLTSRCDVLLGTVLALIKNVSGDFVPIRLVMDSASQSSLITEQCASKLGFNPIDSRQCITGVGSSPAFTSKGKIPCTIRSRISGSPELHSYADVVPSITFNLPQRPIPAETWQRFSSYQLADPEFWKPGPVDFLAGANLFGHIITGAPIILSENDPQLINTIFGHIIIGQLNCNIFSPESSSTSLLTTSTDNIAQIMTKFWETEEVVSDIPKHSPAEQECENHFLSSYSRVLSGKYMVRLPFNSSTPPTEFGGSKQQALTRFYNLEQKLRKDFQLKEDYHQFMKEYSDMGHMIPATEPGVYFIPHHPVYKGDFDKRKLRVVFDASARSSKGSLNNHLHIGPKLQGDISDITLRFRCHSVAFTCDIVKMFRMIEMHPSDRKYQQIIWRFNSDDPIRIYELTTVTYGVSSSPYHSIRVLKQLCEDEGEPYPLAVSALEDDTYVDDVVTGSSSVQKAETLKHQLIQLLTKGGFQLSKWTSNCPSLIQDEDQASGLVALSDDQDPSVKILGLVWDPHKDELSYSISQPEIKFTKRSILSAIGKLYDPLGYLSPVTFMAKTILQETWKASIGWDEDIPDSLKKFWTDFIMELPYISQVKIPRFLSHDNDSNLQLFGFCDASSKGYCACIYLHVRSANGSSSVYLLKGKTRLAPIKTLTIPRLELCSALLLSQLFISIKHFCKLLNISKITFFTDATTVLAWLKTPAPSLKTFVAHRVVRILELVDADVWRYIPTNDNPADCGSRGLLSSKLIHHPLWWSGPSWLHLPEDKWPTAPLNVNLDDLPEVKSTPVTMVTTLTISSDFFTAVERYSTLTKLIRVFAQIYRWIEKGRKAIDYRYSGLVSREEFVEVETKLIRIHQHQFYPEAFGQKPTGSTLLSSLGAFVDQRGLLRVGGRLSESNLPFDQRHPILLPRRCHFTSLVVDYYHHTCFHIGPQALQTIISERYWIPSLKNLLKQRKGACITCIRYSKKSKPPQMGNLPASRFTQDRPFYHTGVDFAGPFLCRDSRRRNAAATKAYLCLFVRFSTKALHLEIVPSLSTEGFLDALDRFVSRRGVPAKIFSDRGTNFLGAANYFKEIFDWLKDNDTQASIINHTNLKGISWTFNPPYSPHFGGLWEAGVKSVKTLLKKMFGDRSYTESELNTAFTKVEAVLNSRPLCQRSSDPNDLLPLTPGDFLIGTPIISLPEEDLGDIPDNRLSQWQRIRQRVQFFWKRWRQEYLNTLQQRHKWTKPVPNINVGDLVLLTDTNLTPQNWPLGRVLETHPGKDGVVRVATLKTSKGTYKRPVVKLVSLEDAVRLPLPTVPSPSTDTSTPAESSSP